MNKYIFIAFLPSFFLSACSSNGPLFHSWGDYSDEGQTKGIYLVEEPYEVKGVWYYPAEKYDYSEQGLASWYMPAGENALTANGEIYNSNILTARHKTLPLPSLVRVTNLENNKSVIVRVNDRGPMVNNRLIDVSKAAKEALEMPVSGTVMVNIELLADESKQLKAKLMEQTSISEKNVFQEENLTLVQPKTEEENTVVPLEEQKILYKPEEDSLSDEKETSSIIQKKSNISLGSFANADNANKLQEKLSQKYPVHIEQQKKNGRLLNVVKVGPYSKNEVKTMLNELKQKGFKDAYITQ